MIRCIGIERNQRDGVLFKVNAACLLVSQPAEEFVDDRTAFNRRRMAWRLSKMNPSIPTTNSVCSLRNVFF